MPGRCCGGAGGGGRPVLRAQEPGPALRQQLRRSSVHPVVSSLAWYELTAARYCVTGRQSRPPAVARADCVFDVIGPLVAYSLLRSHGFSEVTALVLSGVLPAFGVALAVLRHRRLNAIGALVLAGIAVGAVLGLATGSARLVLLEGSVPTGIFAVVCLASLWSSRPLIFRFALEFIGADTPKGRDFADRWRYDGFRHAFHAPRCRRSPGGLDDPLQPASQAQGRARRGGEPRPGRGYPGDAVLRLPRQTRSCSWRPAGYRPAWPAPPRPRLLAAPAVAPDDLEGVNVKIIAIEEHWNSVGIRAALDRLPNGVRDERTAFSTMGDDQARSVRSPPCRTAIRRPRPRNSNGASPSWVTSAPWSTGGPAAARWTTPPTTTCSPPRPAGASPSSSHPVAGGLDFTSAGRVLFPPNYPFHQPDATAVTQFFDAITPRSAGCRPPTRQRRPGLRARRVPAAARRTRLPPPARLPPLPARARPWPREPGGPDSGRCARSP